MMTVVNFPFHTSHLSPPSSPESNKSLAESSKYQTCTISPTEVRVIIIIELRPVDLELGSGKQAINLLSEMEKSGMCVVIIIIVI